jgi:L-ascorbate metabolism protein UlaG (beta-lactamase superfamily)
MKSLYFLLLIPTLLWASPYPKSDHFDGEKFFNPEFKHENSFWDVVKWKWTSDDVKWEKNVPNKNYPSMVLAPEGKAVLTFINHSTFLIQLQGMNILTDPIFAERVSPYKFIGPKRVRPPGVALERLPKIDLVLISHNHYDHLDIESLKIIDGKYHPLFLVPLGDEKLLKEEGIQNVLAMDWWQEYKLRDTTIVFTPAQHWSARGLFDKSESLWGGYFISHPLIKLFHAGDTGHASHFKKIAEKLGNPDVAMIPIGAYEPRWFMKGHHLNPEEAIFAHKDLGSKFSIGMHFGTFPLTDEGREQPVQELEIALSKHEMDPDYFMVLDHGESKGF